MVIRILLVNNEYWTVTERTAKPHYSLKNAANTAAELIERTAEDEVIFVDETDYSVYEKFAEEDKAEHPDWNFVPEGKMWYFDALNEHKNIAIANREQIKESIRSLEIGKEQYK